MPYYNIVAEVIETRAYQIHARNEEEALANLKSELDILPFDLLERDLDTANVEEED